MSNFSVALRNAVLDAVETYVGTNPKIELRTGAPALPDAAATGTLLGTGTLPFDWLAAAAAASKGILGTWAVLCSVAGLAGHYRLLKSDGVTCFESGTFGTVGTDLVGSSATLAVGQTVTITAKPYTA